MKKVLITGANSYIGTSFERYINENHPEEFQINTIDMIDGSWRNESFSGYDSVFHVAGIAHSDNRKISKHQEMLYYLINTNLTIEVAEKAKYDGVRQFVFMSSAIVYGDSAPIGKKKVITRDTPVSPANCYGNSKVQAENGIIPLQDDLFNVVILRPPMIYGKGSKGNYPLLAKIAQRFPIFPYIDNERSMIYIENFCEFVRLMIRNEEKGIYWPQNSEYSNTSELLQMIAEVHGKKIWLVKGLAGCLKILSYVTILVNKAFGNLSYDKKMSYYTSNYWIYDLRDSILKSEAN